MTMLLVKQCSALVRWLSLSELSQSSLILTLTISKKRCAKTNINPKSGARSEPQSRNSNFNVSLSFPQLEKLEENQAWKLIISPVPPLYLSLWHLSQTWQRNFMLKTVVQIKVVGATVRMLAVWSNLLFWSRHDDPPWFYPWLVAKALIHFNFSISA